MRRMSEFALIAIVLLGGAQAVEAQILDTRLRTATTSPTTDQLLERIVALEARLARLEGLLSVVNGTVVLDGRGAPVMLKGSTVTLQADRDFEVRAGNTAKIDASAVLMLKGFAVVFNNGTRAVACAGGVTSPATKTEPHAHTLVGCGTSVLVP